MAFREVSGQQALSNKQSRLRVSGPLFLDPTWRFMVLINQLYLYLSPTYKPLKCLNMVRSIVISTVMTG